MFSSKILRTPCLRFVRRVHKWMCVQSKLIAGSIRRDTTVARQHLSASSLLAQDFSMDASMSNLNIVSVARTLTCAVNRAGTLHGGVVMTLIDSGGSLVVATNGYRNTGVSTDMNGTFVRPAGRAGEQIRVKSEMIGMGKTLAYTRTELRDLESDTLLGMLHLMDLDDRGCPHEAMSNSRSLWKPHQVHPCRHQSNRQCRV